MLRKIYFHLGFPPDVPTTIGRFSWQVEFRHDPLDCAMQIGQNLLRGVSSALFQIRLSKHNAIFLGLLVIHYHIFFDVQIRRLCPI